MFLRIVVLISIVALAFGQNSRSWVSSTGSDANPCTRSQPCASFQTAVLNTNQNGEVDVVDPAEYGPVSLMKGITIDGGGMARITSISPSPAITAVPHSTGPMIIRNLSINGFSGLQIVCPVCLLRFRVRLENVEFSTLSGPAFSIQAPGTLSVERSNIHDTAGGLTVQGGDASAPVTVQLRDIVMSNVGTAVNALASSTVTLDTSLLVNNSVAVSAPSGTVKLSNCTITDNQTGLSSAGGNIVSFINNRLFGNVVDGTPTISVPQQ